MHWSEALVRGISRATRMNGRLRITVHKQTQAILGRMALDKMAREHLDRISFVIDRDIHPVGTVINAPQIS